MFHNYYLSKIQMQISHYTFTVLFLLLAGFVYAQDKPLPKPPADGIKFTLAPTFIKPDVAVPVVDRQALLSQFLPVAADVEMRPLRSEVDQLGMEHTRYQQLYKGLEVEGAVYTTHARGGLLQSMNGYFVTINNFDVSPAIDEAQALVAAIAHSKGREFAWEAPGLAPGEDYNYPKGQLVVMASQQFGTSPRLAWKFDIYAVEPLYRAYVFIDAKTGEFIFENLRIHHANVPATGTSLYNGTVNFTADQIDPTSFRLRQTTSGGGIETYNMNNTTNYGAATDFTSTTSNFTSDNTGVQAHWGAEQTWDYFMSDHGRNSYDGAGAVIKSYVHFSVNYVNAFWNGAVMTYGDGNGSYNPLVSLDVCGHEITHGVTSHTANLVYSYESGALNESFSDIFGEMVEHHGQGSNDWIIGDEIISGGIRNMSNPNIHSDPDTYLGNYWWTNPGDNGGVHTNSGVQNKWFYLLCVGEIGVNDFGYNYNVPAIGFTKAAAIAYRNLSVYLGPNSKYIDARNGAIQAAEDLYGVNSPEALAVDEAWKAVGVPCSGASNDDVCNALPIDIGVPINANSFCASAQPGEVSPGAGTGSSSCNSQDGWCSSETEVQNSLWFTFVAPPSGRVDISTSNTDDTQLAIWSVGDCNDFNTFTEIAANDDGGPDFAPFIDGACLLPGQTYYIQIDGYGGANYNTNITVSDAGPSLTLTCPPNQTELAGANCVDLPDYTGLATVIDNCGVPSLSQSPPAGTNLQASTTVTMTVTSSSGNVKTCNFEVIVQDNTPPTAACLNPTVQLDANGNASITTADVFDAANSSDNCSTPYPVFVTPNAFTCADIGANTVTLQIIDNAGNTALCTATVTVEDDTPPEAKCKNIPLVLDANGVASIIPSDIDDGSSDLCGPVTLSVDEDEFYCSDLFEIEDVELTVTDGSGNTSTCVAIIDVQDNTVPVAVCQDLTVELDNGGVWSTGWGDIDGGSTDACGIATYLINGQDFVEWDCSNVGVTTAVLTTIDESGNFSTCNATVTIEDNILPTALCQNFTTDLDADGTYTLVPSSVDAGSNDACGISLSVSPNQFDCGDIGANTVTLTATDDNGNSATCTATVTINDFVTINSITSTAESCAGQGDGTISINASALGGTLMYSINGGASYQGNSTFTSVSPGTYNVKVLAQGTGCEASGTVTVAAGAAPTTWYKDLDGDGYTDGITATGCSAPAGYVASAQPGDCNDNDAAVNPGAAEACNGLDDNCDGIVPADEQDNDADGYRVCDGDCDDNNPAVNPGATEICNGIDDDCDGQIDEGTTGNQVYVGNVVFTSQAAVDNFSQCYYKIQGNLTILGTGINSLANLSNLQEVTGSVLIQVTSLPNLNGLDALTTIGGTLTIKLNNYGAKLSSLSGLGNLTSIGQNLFISFNFSLSDCCSIDDLLSNAGVGGVTSIFSNASGCNSVSDISTTCGGGSLVVLPGNSITFGETAEQPRMSLFPNPATSTVTILLEGIEVADETKVQLYDQFGRLAHTMELAEGQKEAVLQIATNELPTGVYQVVLRSSATRMVERLIIKN